MRHVIKPKNSCPNWLLPVTVRSKIEAIARSGNTSLITDTIYSNAYTGADGRPASHTRDILNNFYLGKCAYCEKHCRADVEHYRPKGIKKGDDAHSGYPWLCYEWSNLIPACIDCNGRSGKLSKFPVSGTRVTVPHPRWLPQKRISVKYHKADSNYLLNEMPLMLHPEIDDPIQFLAFRPHPQLRGFEVYGTDTDGRGDKTAEVCHLNRQDLLSDRLDILRNMRQAIDKAFQDNDLGHIPDDKFPDSLKLLFEQWEADSNDIELTHTLLRKFVVRDVANLDLLVSQFIDPTLRIVILQYFQAYKAGQL